MREAGVRILSGVTLSLAIAGCGGGGAGGGGGGGATPPTPTTIAFTFTGGTPTAAAVQTGTSSFAASAVQSGKVSFALPSGTTKFAIAYACPPVPGFGNTVTSEHVIEATTSDGKAFTVSCGGYPATGTATGSANATAIAGSANVYIRGKLGFGGAVGSNNGPFSVSLPAGTNDVAAFAVDSASPPNVLAVKILRGQTVPGAVNGGSAITLAASDAVKTESLSVTNVPAGFVSPPAVAVEYVTAGGTSLLLDSTSATQYPAVPSTAAQSGDYYIYQANTDDTATHSSAVGITQTTTSGGGAATIALPAKWSYAGPTAAVYPTFTFAYTGFASLPAVAQQGEIEWAPTATTLTTITAIATASYQAGATTIAIPNLSSIAGFSHAAAAGATIYWVADVFGGTTQDFVSPMPPNASLGFVQNEGNYTQP